MEVDNPVAEVRMAKMVVLLPILAVVGGKA